MGQVFNLPYNSFNAVSIVAHDVAMKMIALNTTDLDACVADAQSQRIVLTRDGAPVALVVGVSGLDREQIELGTSARFWKLIQSRRKEKTVSRAELELAIKRKTAKRKRS